MSHVFLKVADTQHRQPLLGFDLSTDDLGGSPADICTAVLMASITTDPTTGLWRFHVIGRGYPNIQEILNTCGIDTPSARS